MQLSKSIAFYLVVFTLVACAPQDRDDQWRALFNGAGMDGWIPKITGYALGENYANTFRVQDGMIQARYAEYDSFDNKFGHLFYEEPFQNYHLKVEYQFVGDQVAGGPGWAWRNSGIMFHCQPPETMTVDQDFPISLEAQFLGGDGSNDRPTMNLCTPGTHVYMNDKLVTNHCITSDASTFHGDVWVTAEIIARGEHIWHLTNGDTVMYYTRPEIGGGVVDAFDPAAKQDGQPLLGGYIALQSESHPINFRSVMIRKLGE